MSLRDARNEKVRNEHGSLHKTEHQLWIEIGSLHKWPKLDLA